MTTIATNNPPNATASIHAQSAHAAQLNAQVRSFYAKQTQFTACPNRRKCCSNNGLSKYSTLPKPKKQTQFRTHHLPTTKESINMQNKPNLRKAKTNLTSCGHKDYENMRVREPRKNKPNHTQSKPISKTAISVQSPKTHLGILGCHKTTADVTLLHTASKRQQVNMAAKKQITRVGDTLHVLAPAKINLTLLIAGKRPDGFHEIETVMARIDYYDEITIQPGKNKGIELLCTGPYWAPQGSENLVHRAAQLLFQTCNTTANVKITLRKNIPAGSGLGSASSDAAATLIGLNEFLHLSLDRAALAELAATLGSDVPFFLGGPMALCTGRGEKIEALNEKFDFTAILFLPDINVSTKKVYGNYRHHQDIYQSLKVQINSHIGKNRFDLLAPMCANMLQNSCFTLVKELADLKAKIESLGFAPLCLSGSGSAMFFLMQGGNKQAVMADPLKLEQMLGCKSVSVSNNRW
jgi:4-diphosphocytidyl-2-C-methyl-D-erythritol kinase